MAAKDSEIAFIQNKIMDISYAKFSTDLNPEFCLFNNVIKTLKSDSDGNIWFFTWCKGEYAKNINQEFFTCLDYYQKGRNSYLRITGKASITETDTDLAYAQIAGNNTVLIKCKIIQAEYFEYDYQYKMPVRERIIKYISGLFNSNSHRIFYFSAVT